MQLSQEVTGLIRYIFNRNNFQCWAKPQHQSEIKVPRESQYPLSTILISHPPLVLTLISPLKGFCLLGIMCHSSLGSWNFSQVQVIAKLCQMPRALQWMAQGKLQFLGGKGQALALAFTSTVYQCLTQPAGGLRWSTAAKIAVSPFKCSQGC